MQASKIVPGNIYAVRVPNVELRPYVRVRVTEVQTTASRKVGSAKLSPHDYSSVIWGTIAPGDMPEGMDSASVKFAPDAVLGPFQDYLDLKEKEAQEKAAYETEQEVRQERRTELLRRFYDAVDLPLPARLEVSDVPFRADFRHGIEISHKGVALLLEAAAKKEAS